MFRNIAFSKCSKFPSVSSFIIKRNVTVPPKDAIYFHFPRIKAPQFRLKNTPFSWMPEKEREIYAKFLQYYFSYDYAWNMENFWSKDSVGEKMLSFAAHAEDTPLGFIKDKMLQLKRLDSNHFTFNFFSEKQPLENMIETMGLHYHCSDWPIWGNFHIKNELDTVRKTYVPLYSQVINADEVRGEAIEAFEKIMQALYQKNLDNLASNMIPIDSKSKIAEDKQILKGLIDSNLQNRNSKKSIEKLEFYVGKLKEENSKNYELLNATSKDVLFVPESVDGQIFWDVRRIVMTGEFRRIFLLYTVPVIALYKKKTLFESVQHLEYVRKGTKVPFIEIPKEYGYSRPVRISALIQFVNEIPKIGELSLERKLFGFHIQVPKTPETFSREEDFEKIGEL